MSIAAELAKRIVALRYEDLPEAAIDTAKMAVLDTIGVALAGCREQAPKIVESVLGNSAASGPSLVFGGDRRMTCLDAALINGTSAHALDFDDCNNTLGGHPSAPILPGLVALGEEIDAGGRELLLAYIVGFETETRIASGVNFHHYEKGWHPTATLGVFGAAAACAKLLGLSEDRVATALALGVSLASGVKANFGTMTKPLHVGECSRNGLMAALLAREGFTANHGAFEHSQGFLNVFNGPGTFDAGRILERWADPLDIVTPGIAFKQYPCCGSTHSAIDAALEIVRAHSVDPERITRVDCKTHARRLKHTNRPDPQSTLEAKFSVQYCVARALIDKRVVLEHFEGTAFRDPRVRRLIGRVHAEPYTEAEFDASNHFGGEVAVTLDNGQTYPAKVETALGRISANPIPPELLKAKFENCAGKVLSPEDVAQLHASVKELQQLRSVLQLTAIIANGASTTAQLHESIGAAV